MTTKHCRACSEPLVRREREGRRDFEERAFCGRVCSSKKHKPPAYVQTKPFHVRAEELGEDSNPKPAPQSSNPMRDLMCGTYDRCLDHAIAKEWEGFRCNECPRSSCLGKAWAPQSVSNKLGPVTEQDAPNHMKARAAILHLIDRDGVASPLAVSVLSGCTDRNAQDAITRLMDEGVIVRVARGAYARKEAA